MEAYVRKLYNKHFFIIAGIPENHKGNSVAEEFYTRRQAIRYANNNGYDLIIRSRAPKYERSA